MSANHSGLHHEFAPPKEFSPSQLVEVEAVKDHLRQPSLWLAGAVTSQPAMNVETSVTQVLTPDQMREQEVIQERLAQCSPWLL